MPVKTAILMINLGGPKTPELVKPFLVRMFSDTTFIRIPFGLGPHIAKLRADKSVRKQYETIGGSPLEQWTHTQGRLMVEQLDARSPATAPHKIYPCFRYCSPDSEEACQSVAEDSPERIVAFTQYPQYSCATTGNSLRELTQFLPQNTPVSVISRWSTHPAYIQAWATIIGEQLQSFSDPSKVAVVFTAHSVPAKVVWEGDIYAYEIAATVSNVMQQFNNRYHLFWQSKVGFQQWLAPGTDRGLTELGKQGVRDVLLVPIAFTQEHLETLFELDHEYVPAANKAGMNVKRCPAPNDHPQFIDAMTQVVMENLHEGKHSYIPRCVHCPFPEECQKLGRFQN